MDRRLGKVIVAMSGGVDSSVAAALLVEQGYEVVGLFMRLGTSERNKGVVAPSAPADSLRLSPSAGRPHQGCCSAADASDARYVAGMLGIPFYALNFSDDFERIIDDFAGAYATGRTPNPCVVCNNQLKFGRLIEYADAVGADFIATGHYARIRSCADRFELGRAADARKDQSYFLFGLDRRVLPRVMFPIGDMNKQAVRDMARRRGFPNSDKPDSVEICFVPDRDVARVVRARRPESFVEGDILDTCGRVIGRHEGLARFTIGQRRRLGVALGKPAYVTRLDVLNNTVTLGPREALLGRRLIAGRANWLVDVPDSFRASVKIRYLHGPAAARVDRLDHDRIRVIFDEPQSAITPGQAAVLYDADTVLGGAWIDEAEPDDAALAPLERPKAAAGGPATVRTCLPAVRPQTGRMVGVGDGG